MKIARISHLNFLMTIFILLLHTRVGSSTVSDVPGWYIFFDKEIVNLTTAAVPTFFSISAFLLFRNYTLAEYKKKVMNRTRSLVIPYFIFSSVGLIVINILKYLKNGTIDINLIAAVQDIYNCTYDSPIWYLRALFYFVLVSPCILIILKKFQYWGLFILLTASIACNLALKIPYDTFFFWLPDIIIFSFLGLYRPGIFERPFPKSLVTLSLVIAFTLSLSFTIADTDVKSKIYWLYRMSLPLLYVPISSLFKWNPLPIYKATFFVYMIHGIINSIAASVYKDFSSFNIIFSFVRPISVICISYAVYLLIKKLSPSFFAVLNGERK